jgi:hypothetical protein
LPGWQQSNLNSATPPAGWRHLVECVAEAAAWRQVACREEAMGPVSTNHEPPPTITLESPGVDRWRFSQ